MKRVATLQKVRTLRVARTGPLAQGSLDPCVDANRRISRTRKSRFSYVSPLTLRGIQVILDRDIAMLYGVETKVLNQTVKRNRERFPDRFMFQLTEEELEN